MDAIRKDIHSELTDFKRYSANFKRKLSLIKTLKNDRNVDLIRAELAEIHALIAEDLAMIEDQEAYEEKALEDSKKKKLHLESKLLAMYELFEKIKSIVIKEHFILEECGENASMVEDRMPDLFELLKNEHDLLFLHGMTGKSEQKILEELKKV